MKYIYIIIIFVLLISVASCKRTAEENQILAADSLFALAVQNVELTRYEEADRVFRQLLTLDTDLGRLNKVTRHQLYLGQIGENLGEFIEALQWYDAASRSARRVGDREIELESFFARARIANILGEREHERTTYTDALTLARVLNYPEAEIQALLYLGDRSFSDGRYDLAHQHYVTARQVAVGKENVNFVYLSSLSLAKNFIAQHLYVDAQHQIDQALELLPDIPDSITRLKVILVQGKLFEVTGRYGEALEMYQRALDDYKEAPQNNPIFLNFFDSICHGYLRIHSYRQAKVYYELLYTITDGFDLTLWSAFALLGQSEATLKLGLTETNEEYIKEAMTIAQKALDYFEEAHYKLGFSFVFYLQAKAASFLNETQQSIELYKRSLEYLNEYESPIDSFAPAKRFSQRNDLQPAVSALSQFLVELLLEQGNTREAFTYSEYARLNQLNRIVLRIGILGRSVEERAEIDSLFNLYRLRDNFERERLFTFEQNKKYHQKRIALENGIKGFDQQVAELEMKLIESQPKLAVLFEKDIPNIDYIQKRLRPTEAIVSYFPISNNLIIFVLKDNGLDVITLPISHETLYRRVQDFYSVISTPQETNDDPDVTINPQIDTDYTTASLHLYEILIAPIDRILTHVRRLIFVLPTDLHYVPIHALVVPRQAKISYLAERYSITYLPTVSVSHFATHQTRRIVDIVAMGNPDGSAWDVEYKLRDIRGLYPDTRLYLGRDASVEALLSEKGDVLQIASSFYYNPAHPEHSFFILTEGATISLTQFKLSHLTEIYPFPHVLLANTGDIVEGLNVIHPYLLFINGTKTVTVNYWGRESRAAKWFNENVYSNLLLGLPFGEAFQQSQLTLIATPQYAHPHFWAPFFIYGM